MATVRAISLALLAIDDGLGLGTGLGTHGQAVVGALAVLQGVSRQVSGDRVSHLVGNKLGANHSSRRHGPPGLLLLLTLHSMHGAADATAANRTIKRAAMCAIRVIFAESALRVGKQGERSSIHLRRVSDKAPICNGTHHATCKD